MSAAQTRPCCYRSLPKGCVCVCVLGVPSVLEAGPYALGVPVPESALSGACWAQLGLTAVSVAGHLVATSLD